MSAEVIVPFAITTERIRLLMSGKGNITQASTEEAQAFVRLFGSQMTDALNQTLKDFVRVKMLGSKEEQ